MKLQGGETVNLTEVLYVPQAVKNIIRVSRLVSRVSTMGDSKDKTKIKKVGVRLNLDTRKGKIIAQYST